MRETIDLITVLYWDIDLFLPRCRNRSTTVGMPNRLMGSDFAAHIPPFTRSRA